MQLPRAPRVNIADILSADQVITRLSGRQRDEVLSALIARIPVVGGDADARQTLLRALLEREELCSTGIGDGVALPHARSALVGVVDAPVVVFGRHVEGIAYRAIDNEPARLFFLLVAPNVSQHLQILARLSRLLRDHQLRRGLLAAERADQVLALIRNAEASMGT